MLHWSECCSRGFDSKNVSSYDIKYGPAILVINILIIQLLILDFITQISWSLRLPLRNWSKGLANSRAMVLFSESCHIRPTRVSTALRVMCPTGKTPATSDCLSIPVSLFNRPSCQWDRKREAEDRHLYSFPTAANQTPQASAVHKQAYWINVKRKQSRPRAL